MPRSKKPEGGEKPPRAPRRPSKKQPPPEELKPANHEEDFEHTLRRLVITRDGLGRG